MNITINGKIVVVMQPKSGVTKNGSAWTSQDFVIEGENGEKFCFNIFGEDKIKESGLRGGVVASVTCKLESKEWNGKWFTSLSCQNCIVQGNAQPHQPMQSPQQRVQQQNVVQQTSEVKASDLPF